MKENRPKVVIGLFIISILILAACASAPETVEVTRVVQVPVVETVEVTRVVEVTVRETVEVTRIVEVPVEVTPTPPETKYSAEELVAEIKQEVEGKGNCTVSPDGSGFTSMGGGFTSMGGGTYVLLDPNQYHGDYVYSTVADTVLQLQSDGVSNNTEVTEDVAILVIDHFNDSVVADYKIIDQIHYDSAQIFLVQVNIDQFDTDVVTNRVAQAINEINAGEGIERFVLNMSWIIVPCEPAHLLDVAEYIVAFCTATDIADDLGEFGDRMAEFALLEKSMYDICTDKQTLKNAIKNISGKEYFYSLDRAVQPWFEILPNDPFYQFIACYEQQSRGVDPGQESEGISKFFDESDFQPELQCNRDLPIDPGLLLFPIAAAGNSSLENSGGPVEFPFFPALWDGVLSVSALDSTKAKRASYSNFGEVMIEDSSTLLYNGMELEGTSFSAPRISALGAVFLGQDFDHSLCESAQGTSFTTTFPALGYMTEGDSSQGFVNLEVKKAAENYCALFPVP